MIAQELSLLEDLLQRLAAVHGVQKDAQADALIRARLAAQPDALYLLVQRTLLLEHALDDARRELAQRAAMPADPGGTAFLQRGLEPGFGRNAVDPDAYSPGAPVYRGGPTTAPGAAPATAPGSGAAPPAHGWRERFFGAAPAASPMAGGGSGLLGQAATTAAGVAGGMFLFNGIEHLMARNHGGPDGSTSGSFLGLGGSGGIGSGNGNATGTTEVVENVTQNFYDDASGSDDGRRRLADDAGADWPGFDDGSSFDDDNRSA